MQRKMEIENSRNSRAHLGSEQTVVCRAETSRDYILNPLQALEKKKKATDRQNVEISETGGGLRVVLNTGSYELLKVVTEEYFAAISDRRKCKIIHVHDQKGSVVETQFKLTSGKNSLYTLNFYNTTSSCLVNGKKVQIFREKDFPEIMQKIEQKLQMNDITCEQINENFRKIIVNNCEKPTDTNVKPSTSTFEFNALSDGNDSSVDLTVYDMQSQSESENISGPALHCDAQIPVSNHSEASYSLPHVEEVINSVSSVDGNAGNDPLRTADAACQTDFQTGQNDSKLFEICNNMSESLQVFRSFMNETKSQLSCIRDEITSIKKCVNFGTSALKDQVDSLSSRDMIANTETKLALDAMQRRLQSVQDYMRKVWNNQGPPSAHKTTDISTTQDRVELQHESEIVHVRTEESNFSNQGSNRRASSCYEVDINRNTQNSLNSSFRSPNSTKKTLIIGDSIIKGIQKRGLSTNVDILTMPGKKTYDICTNLLSRDLSVYGNIVIYVGGNDIAGGSHHNSVYEKLESTVRSLQHKCTFYLCTLCPRLDTDVVPLNDALKQLCGNLNIALIDCYLSFIFGDGKTIRLLYNRDGIHLGARGSSLLVAAINQKLAIIKERSPEYGSGRKEVAESVHEMTNFRKYTSQPVVRQQRWGNNSRKRALSDNSQRSRLGKRRWVRCNICGLDNHTTEKCRRVLAW